MRAGVPTSASLPSASPHRHALAHSLMSLYSGAPRTTLAVRPSFRPPGLMPAVSKRASIKSLSSGRRVAARVRTNTDVGRPRRARSISTSCELFTSTGVIAVSTFNVNNLVCLSSCAELYWHSSAFGLQTFRTGSHRCNNETGRHSVQCIPPPRRSESGAASLPASVGLNFPARRCN